jgi:hypothetical protein
MNFYDVCVCLLYIHQYDNKKTALYTLYPLINKTADHLWSPKTGSVISNGRETKVVWVEFSTLSLAVLLDYTINAQHANGHFLS